MAINTIYLCVISHFKNDLTLVSNRNMPKTTRNNKWTKNLNTFPHISVFCQLIVSAF